jgi:hypothetical protein
MSFSKKIAMGMMAYLLSISMAQAEVLRGERACGGLTAEESGTDFGPFDYRSAPLEKLKMVHKFHFSSNVENLRGGQSGSIIGTDIDFTLRYFPNHIRALNAMVKLAQREKTDQPKGARYPLDCWFDRAVRFKSDDMQVAIMYGFWLLKKGEKTLAMEQFDKVNSAETRTVNVVYNLGLGYFEAKEYDKALAAAHEAYAAGYSFPGLRSKLQKAGKWVERTNPAPSVEAPQAQPQPESNAE